LAALLEFWVADAAPILHRTWKVNRIQDRNCCRVTGVMESFTRMIVA
jgi:hypothetical protein